MLRRIRKIVAVIFFALITLLFLDFTGTVHTWIGWMAKIQFLPALLSLNVGIIIALIVLTLIFGRIYCSVICPLGVFQDVVSWISGKYKKNRFSYSPALTWLRYGILAVFIIAFILGIGSLVALLAPYSSYGRMASNLFAPIYQLGNNVLAYFSEKVNSYAFYSVDIWIKSIATFLVAIITFAILFFLAWRNGRTYCNTICPVGTILGFIARFSYFKPIINIEKCTGCGVCSRNCKASCIDTKSHKIDYSRCVTCFDCIDQCKQGGMEYGHRHFSVPQKTAVTSTTSTTSEEQVKNSRRKFLSLTALLVTTTVIKAKEKKVDGGLAVIVNKKMPKRSTPITPAGSLSARNFADHCTACQLCVSVCPNQVLRPSTDMKTFMQPEMSYERGYCRPECTKCSDVCPSDAIHPITRAEKSSIQIGHAVWIKENCVILTDNVSCGNCARHCPTGAIQMVAINADNHDSKKIPVVNTAVCIGCGACEDLCPARPFSAIYVEGNEMHRTV
ncbi:MAG: 4Fe-4S dicluster domain-containing protein [Bacteroidaceae bacterium]